ncbi:hypothetical protein LGL08_20335 [Clostridium estertheticum]|uniref:hypothetical protein n=1 Tax=Clostridium estertheticum TaxID=238834 RepID=UPI001CF1D356|nr:hypothetical protein [Clostridium estertheticum]MCB2309055.1 hypothetical protein [Clostridium estertheticum]MCB2346811.1 hypothetical protein [Clostridium estertheticum]MCB2351877.1 hypothetical protein [Clostridium estertheticum]WAG48405.1 hypothetical protein LL127_23140 [Clostridium estertheticum]
MADIYITTQDRSSVLQFPALPEEFPVMSESSRNEEFLTFNNGNFNLQNGNSLITFSLNQKMPMHDYYFNKCDYLNTASIIQLILRSIEEKFPVRFVLKGDNNQDYTNILVTCEKFDYNFDKNLDIVMSADFKEYRALV